MDIDNPWEERDPREVEVLKCLVDAEACLGEAMLNSSIDLYLKALELSEKVIDYFPQCATAHYFIGFALLKATRGKNYALQKYELLKSFKSEDAHILAKKLKAELDEKIDIS